MRRLALALALALALLAVPPAFADGYVGIPASALTPGVSRIPTVPASRPSVPPFDPSRGVLGAVLNIVAFVILVAICAVANSRRRP